MPGKFIIFEGLDGSGKTTQAALLRDYLLNRDRKVLATKNPTDGMIGKLIKSCLRHEWVTDPLTLQMLFAADRSHDLANNIEPALKQGKIVISDRYVLSTLAYGSLDIQSDILKQLNMDFRKPDMTFIIDTEPKICLERIAKTRSHLELFESENKFISLREKFLSLKNYFPETHIIDGNPSIETVSESIKEIVDRVL